MMPSKRPNVNAKGQLANVPPRQPRRNKTTTSSTATANDGSAVVSSLKKRKFQSDESEESSLPSSAPRRIKLIPSGLGLHLSAQWKSGQMSAGAVGQAGVGLAKNNKTTRAKGVGAGAGAGAGADPNSARKAIINEAPTQVLQCIVFGDGDCGELGLGPKEKGKPQPIVNPYLDGNTPNGFRVVQLDCGGMHGIALTRDNKIITWGVNDRGALGRDTAWDGGLRDVDAESDDEDEELNPFESTPTQVSADHFRLGSRFVQVVAGDNCSFALTDTGLVYGWGTFLDAEGKPRFIYANDKIVDVQYTPLLITGLEKITQLACGRNHALALDRTGNVWSWGVGQKNQLGYHCDSRQLESFQPRLVNLHRNKVKYIASGLEHSFAVDQKDNVWAWGLNRYGQAGYAKDAGSDNICLPFPRKIPGLAGKGVTMLGGGADHSIAVTADGQCLVWGRIDGGQLGVELNDEQIQDDTLTRHDDRGHPCICLRPVAVPNIGIATYVGCGTGHTIFVNAEGRAFGSGFGSLGQLGIASEDDTTVAEEITGEAVKGKRLTWCGACGNFSIVAAPAASGLSGVDRFKRRRMS